MAQPTIVAPSLAAGAASAIDLCDILNADIGDMAISLCQHQNYSSCEACVEGNIEVPSGPDYGISATAATNFCQALQTTGLGIESCAANGVGLDIDFKFPVLRNDWFLSTQVNVDVCPASAAGFSPQVTFSDITLQLTSPKRFTDYKVDIFSKLFANARNLGSVSYPPKVGSLGVDMVTQPQVDSTGFDVNVYLEMCYRFDGALMDTLNRAIKLDEASPFGVVPEEAKDLFYSIYGEDKKFCDSDMRDKVVEFYQAFSTLTMGKAVSTSLKPFVDDLEAASLPLKVFTKRIDVGNVCKPGSVAAYSQAAESFTDVDSPTTNGVMRADMPVLATIMVMAANVIF